MKRIISFLLVFALIFTLSGCGSKPNDETAAKTSSSDDGTAEQAEPVNNNSSNIDVDLTTLTSTMVYGEVNNMVTNPDEYIGKNVKMKGSFSIYNGENRMYYACLIADATACCSQGIEFVLDGDYTYPDDYPELFSEITVIGTFDTYIEDGNLYCQLINATLE